ELYKWFLTHKRNVRRYGMSEELDPRLEHQEINSNWVHEDSSPELPKTREAPDVVPTPKRSGVITTLSVATVDQSNRSINNRVLEHPPSIDLNPDEYIQPLTEQGLARQDAIYQADILAAQQLNEQLRKEQRLEWLKFWKWKIKKKRRVEAEKPIREEITYLTPLSDDQLAEQQKIYKHNLMLAEALRRKGEKE
ncbi:MAG: hypothetical protein MK212_19890, partial [Saprospiraceae bacterium]|nr:hypothetical protein [Saprospiraceae bacterium]